MIKDQIITFEQYLKFEKRLSTHTIVSYLNDLDQFSNYLRGTFDTEDFTKVKTVFIRSYIVYLVELKLKERSIQRKVSTIKSFSKFLQKRGLIADNPCKNLKVPKAPIRIPVFLEQQQMQQLFEQAVFPEGFEGLTHQLILELFYQTGIRRAELINLPEKDVDTFRKEIVVLGKRNKERAIPISGNLLQLITEYIREKKQKIVATHDKLLTLDSGKPLYDNYVYRVVKRYLGADITTLSKRSPHVLRHTFATHLTRNGADISAIKDLLGHSSLAATQIYTHSNIEHLKKIYQQAHPKAADDNYK